MITFKDSESAIYILKNMVEPTGGDIFIVEPSNIFDEFNDFLENKAIASEVEIKMNLNKCMSFRDEEKKDLINDDSSIVKKIGNVTKEKETYFELKFKEAIRLAEMYDINFDELKNLIFQIEIKYRKKNGGKYLRVITKQLKVSGNKEEINKIANMDIVSTLQIQKSAKLAAKGNLMEAQAQIHIARNYLGNNMNYSNNNQRIYHQFNSNMNSFHSNLQMSNSNSQMNNQQMMNQMNNMNFMPNMYNPMNNQQMMNMNNMNFMPNMNNPMNSQQMMNMNNMNFMQNMHNPMNNRPMMNMNNMNIMPNSYNPMNNMNNMQNMNNQMNNQPMMNINNDLFSQQIYSLSNTSQSRQSNTYNRSSQSK